MLRLYQKKFSSITKRDIIIYRILLAISVIAILGSILLYILYKPNYLLDVIIEKDNQYISERMMTLEQTQKKINEMPNINSKIVIKRDINNKIMIQLNDKKTFSVKKIWWNHKPAMNVYEVERMSEMEKLIEYYYKWGDFSTGNGNTIRLLMKDINPDY